MFTHVVRTYNDHQCNINTALIFISDKKLCVFAFEIIIYRFKIGNYCQLSIGDAFNRFT